MVRAVACPARSAVTQPAMPPTIGCIKSPKCLWNAYFFMVDRSAVASPRTWPAAGRIGRSSSLPRSRRFRTWHKRASPGCPVAGSSAIAMTTSGKSAIAVVRCSLRIPRRMILFLMLRARGCSKPPRSQSAFSPCQIIITTICRQPISIRLYVDSSRSASGKRLPLTQNELCIPIALSTNSTEGGR